MMPGGAVNLTCVAVGSPMPYVRWRLGAVELSPEETLPIGKNVLMLTDVKESANYTCVAASDLGNIEYIAEVKVKGIEPRVATDPYHPSPGVTALHILSSTSWQAASFIPAELCYYITLLALFL